MKKSFIFLAVAAIAFMVAACVKPVPVGPDEPDDPTPTPTPGPDVPALYDIAIQLQSEGANFAVAGITVAIADDAGVASYDAVTDATGKVSFKLPAGTYAATATYKTAEDGQRLTFNGANNAIYVSKNGDRSFNLNLNKVVSQQIIIKEVYTTGCNSSALNKKYFDDAYIILYNNSEMEADASDIVFAGGAPSMPSQKQNYWLDATTLLFENANWLPSYSAYWWFDSEVKIPAYSQIVVALFGAIDHTQTVAESVDLSNASYYWMNNKSVTAFKAAKYSVSENIPAANYLSGISLNPGTAWVVANSAPAFFIANISKEEATAIAQNKDAYDTYCGTADAFKFPKFPKDNVVDAFEVWVSTNVANSKPRFSTDILTGYLPMTNGMGYTAYRNVDKEATEALEENAGKLVYNYAGGTDDVEGSTDPSGIDAEASIAAGAHIIYSDTNDMAKDYHQRKVASLKK